MADAHGSGPCESNLMRVQVPSPAQKIETYTVSIFMQESMSAHRLSIILPLQLRPSRHRSRISSGEADRIAVAVLVNMV